MARTLPSKEAGDTGFPDEWSSCQRPCTPIFCRYHFSIFSVGHFWTEITQCHSVLHQLCLALLCLTNITTEKFELWSGVLKFLNKSENALRF